MAMKGCCFTIFLIFCCCCFVVGVDGGETTRNWGQVSDVLNQGLMDKVYPGATALVAGPQGVIFAQAVGKLGYEEEFGSPVSLKTSYDLASLTKVLATTTAIMILYQRGQIDLDMKISHEDLLGSDFAQNGKEGITVRHLLLHNSGLSAGPSPTFFSESLGCPETSKPYPELSFSCRDKIYQHVLIQKTVNPIGEVAIYSDLSMIILKYVVGKLSFQHGYITTEDCIQDCISQTGSGIEQCYFEAFVRKHIFERLSMTSATFLVPENEKVNIPPTWFDGGYRNFTMAGVVSDGNAYSLGGISGHAGMFSNIMDLYLLGNSLLFASEDDPWINQSTVSYFSKVGNSDQSSRALGWDTNVYTTSSCSTSFSQSTFLHTGYTGTQMCLDPMEPLPKNSNSTSNTTYDKGLFTILLTNRCHPDDSSESSSGMAAIRKQFNEAVMNAYRASLPIEKK